eukprot:112587-Alexandrium_andersonii.AAC.1
MGQLTPCKRWPLARPPPRFPSGGGLRLPTRGCCETWASQCHARLPRPVLAEEDIPTPVPGR